jgi:hypothetical protein
MSTYPGICFHVLSARGHFTHIRTPLGHLVSCVHHKTSGGKLQFITVFLHSLIRVANFHVHIARYAYCNYTRVLAVLSNAVFRGITVGAETEPDISVFNLPCRKNWSFLPTF